MARQTVAQQIEQANEEEALVFFREALRTLPEPRRRQGIRYPLASVVVTALMAMVCGADNADDMEAWGAANEVWLGEQLALPHGTPTQDVFLAVFGAIEPEALRAVFLAWMDLLRARLGNDGQHIAIDGKTSRGSADLATGRPALHTVSAWLSDAGLVLGQRKVDDKANEIVAIPKLLRDLNLRGATVTIDAIGCQTEIAQTIVDGQGDYLLAVKRNQPALHSEVVETFAEVDDPRRRTVDEPARPTVEVFEETEKGHGRLEHRRVELCRDLTWVASAPRWAHLACVVRVTRSRTVLSTGKTSTESAYYIGSDASLDAATAARHIRRHWAIENELHWVLDMAFREDDARHRARHTAQNFTMMRHFALNLIKRFPDRKGVAGARKRAGWDSAYLLRILTEVSA